MTSTMLKVVALVTMLIDHIWAFIPGMPYYFHWIGRISAPIFIFCCIVSYTNTNNKRKYMARLYIFSLVMGVVNYFLDIQYNFIRTLFIIVVVIYLIEKFEVKNKKAKMFLLFFTLWQILSIIIIILLENAGLNEKTLFLVVTVLFSILGLDGGLYFVFIGVIIYICKDNKKYIGLSYTIISVFNMVVCNTTILKRMFNRIDKIINNSFEFLAYLSELIFGIHPAFINTDMLYGDPQWMMIFALPFILMYNGEKGRGFKYLFYVFYPVHIIILYYVGIALIK